jgi:hypothetical protein
MKTSDSLTQAVAEKNQPTLSDLRSLPMIRRQCQRVYERALENTLSHFTVNENRLDRVVDFIAQLIAEDTPDWNILFHSRWRHFEAGGIARQLNLEQQWKVSDPREVVRRHIDLVVVSVLLDAGAGPNWSYKDASTGRNYGRSEGLGLASLQMFSDGCFSSDPSQPHQVDADALARLTVEDLQTGFQVTAKNPLLGLEGRVLLLKNLAHALKTQGEFFGHQSSPRPGGLMDWLLGDQPTMPTQRSVTKLWQAVIEGFEDVWPREGRILLNGHNIGDAWHHSALGSKDDLRSIVPFHKLSQWLTYSLLEPLIRAGVEMTDMEQLTGLPEYRNGGLFIDFDVLSLKNPDAVRNSHRVDSELIVEWRALTVVLLDKTAQKLRLQFNKSERELPLAKVLEAGTWKAGRRIAAQKRDGGLPPLQVVSDGTVF